MTESRLPAPGSLADSRSGCDESADERSLTDRDGPRCFFFLGGGEGMVHGGPRRQ